MKCFIALALSAILAGCFKSNGWQFQVGIVPINQVEDTKTLNHK